MELLYGIFRKLENELFFRLMKMNKFKFIRMNFIRFYGEPEEKLFV